MARADGVFHVAMGASLLLGLALAGSVADELWEGRNQGVRCSKQFWPSLGAVAACCNTDYIAITPKANTVICRNYSKTCRLTVRQLRSVFLA